MTRFDRGGGGGGDDPDSDLWDDGVLIPEGPQDIPGGSNGSGGGFDAVRAADAWARTWTWAATGGWTQPIANQLRQAAGLDPVETGPGDTTDPGGDGDGGGGGGGGGFRIPQLVGDEESDAVIRVPIPEGGGDGDGAGQGFGQAVGAAASLVGIVLGVGILGVLAYLFGNLFEIHLGGDG